MGKSMTRAGWARILCEEDGAITVDWVVLTAAVVSMGMLAGTIVWTNSGSVARNVSSYIGSQSVITTF